jgi:hypothetical protein
VQFQSKGQQDSSSRQLCHGGGALVDMPIKNAPSTKGADSDWLMKFTKAPSNQNAHLLKVLILIGGILSPSFVVVGLAHSLRL